MKVKVGDKIYSDKEQPLMIILTDQDKKNIANMLPECTMYASDNRKDHFTDKELEEWMKIDKIKKENRWIRKD